MDIIFYFFLILFIYFVYKTINLDCDYTLAFIEKFGKKSSDLKGKIVWITGASSGIGKAVSYELAKVGCKLVLSGTKADQLNLVKKECLEINENLLDSNILVLPFNVTDYNEQENSFKKLLNHFGKLDILVNNAGIAQSGEFENIELSLDKFIFEVNVFGVINLTRIVCRNWLKSNQKGLIVINSSTSAILKNPYTSSYAASKAAINGYLESMRKEYWNTNIKLTVICPGPVDTNIFHNAYTRKLGCKIERDFINVSKNAGVFHWITAKRCAELFAVAISNEVAECWIAKQPILVFTFVNSYLPFLSSFIWNIFLNKNEKALKNLYL